MNLLSDGTARNVLRLIFTFSCYDLVGIFRLFSKFAPYRKKKMDNKKKCIYLRVPSELCNCLYKSMNLT